MWVLFVIVLLVINVFWLFFFIDKSVTIDYMQQGLVSCQEGRSVLATVIESRCLFGTKETTAIEMKKLFPDMIVSTDQDTVFVDDVGFSFLNDKFSKVVFLNK